MSFALAASDNLADIDAAVLGGSFGSFLVPHPRSCCRCGRRASKSQILTAGNAEGLASCDVAKRISASQAAACKSERPSKGRRPSEAASNSSCTLSSQSFPDSTLCHHVRRAQLAQFLNRECMIHALQYLSIRIIFCLAPNASSQIQTQAVRRWHAKSSCYACHDNEKDSTVKRPKPHNPRSPQSP